jgi:hypothetical protein
MKRFRTVVAIAALLIAGPAMAQNYYNPRACVQGFYLSPITRICVRQPTYERYSGAVAFCADLKFSYAIDPREACAGPHGGVVGWLQ